MTHAAKKLLSVADIDGVALGNVSDEQGLSGCTAVVFPRGAVAAHVARGVATGSRELAVFTPRHLVEHVHGVCLSGGSAFGLAAASGVTRELAAAGIGYGTPGGPVPLVGSAVVYDLDLGDAAARPDERAGALAARRALDGEPVVSGNVGAGTGVSAGKILGVSHATKTGLGHAGSRADDGLEVAATVVLNPVGDVLDGEGSVVAGTRVAPEARELRGGADIVRGGAMPAVSAHNTTLVLVATNAALSRVECQWVCEQSAVALARHIDPPFTRHDGDVLFCASVGAVQAEIHRVGLLARDVVAAALLDAVWSAAAAGGLPCARDLVP